MGTALLLALAIGVPLGLLAAVRSTPLSTTLGIVSLATISTPSFFLGLAAIYVCRSSSTFAYIRHVHRRGTSTIGETCTTASAGRHSGAQLTGPFVRYARAGLLEVIAQDYLTTARARVCDRGSSSCATPCQRAHPADHRRRVQYALFAGAVVVEQIFPGGHGPARPGIDHPARLPGADGLHADHRVLVLVSNLVVDVATRWSTRGFACNECTRLRPRQPRLLYQAGHTRLRAGRPHRWRCALSHHRLAMFGWR